MNAHSKREDDPSSFDFPAGTDVSKFAKAIGLDLIYDSQFKWLIDQALSSPLPEDYRVYINPEGKAFFVRGSETSWEHPLIEPYKQIYTQVTAEYVVFLRDSHSRGS